MPLCIGFGIMYYQFNTMSQDQIEKTKITFLKADYFYIFLSLVISVISCWSRSYRWKFALNHLGYTTKFRNDFLDGDEKATEMVSAFAENEIIKEISDLLLMKYLVLQLKMLIRKDH